VNKTWCILYATGSNILFDYQNVIVGLTGVKQF